MQDLYAPSDSDDVSWPQFAALRTGQERTGWCKFKSTSDGLPYADWVVATGQGAIEYRTDHLRIVRLADGAPTEESVACKSTANARPPLAGFVAAETAVIIQDQAAGDDDAASHLVQLRYFSNDSEQVFTLPPILRDVTSVVIQESSRTLFCVVCGQDGDAAAQLHSVPLPDAAAPAADDDTPAPLAARQVGHLPAHAATLRCLPDDDSSIVAVSDGENGASIFNMINNKSDAVEWELLPVTVPSVGDGKLHSRVLIGAGFSCCVAAGGDSVLHHTDLRNETHTWTTIAIDVAAPPPAGQGDAEESGRTSPGAAAADADEKKPDSAAADEAETPAAGSENAGAAAAPADDDKPAMSKSGTANTTKRQRLMTPAERGRQGLAPLPPPPSSRSRRRAASPTQGVGLLPLLTPSRRTVRKSSDDDASAPPACTSSGAPLVQTSKAAAAQSALQHALLRSLLSGVRRQQEAESSPKRSKQDSGDAADHTTAKEQRKDRATSPSASHRRASPQRASPSRRPQSSSEPTRTNDRQPRPPSTARAGPAARRTQQSSPSPTTPRARTTRVRDTSARKQAARSPPKRGGKPGSRGGRGVASGGDDNAAVAPWSEDRDEEEQADPGPQPSSTSAADDAGDDAAPSSQQQQQQDADAGAADEGKSPNDGDEGDASDAAEEDEESPETEAEEQATPPTSKKAKKKRVAAKTKRGTSPDSPRRRGASPRKKPAGDPPAATMPSESVIIALFHATQPKAKKTSFSFASCEDPNRAADILLVSRIVEGAPVIKTIDLAARHFGAIATSQLSAMLSASPHVSTIITDGATFDDPTVRIVLESQVDQNCQMRDNLVDYRKQRRRKEAERQAAEHQERKVVVRRLRFYARQRRDAETLEAKNRLNLEAAWASRVVTAEETLVFSCIVSDEQQQREHQLAVEAHAAQQAKERADVEQSCDTRGKAIERDWEQQAKQLFARWDEDRVKLNRREVELAKNQKRQRDGIEREEKTLRLRHRREEEDKRAAVLEEEHRGRRRIKERVEEERRRQREAEIAEVLRQQRLKQEEQERREALEHQDKEHRRERDSLEKDALKVRETEMNEEKKARKELQSEADASYEVALRRTKYNHREEERSAAAREANTMQLKALSDRVHVIQGNVTTPICLPESELVVDCGKPVYMQRQLEVLANASKGPRTSAAPMTRDQERGILISNGVDPLEAHEITNSEWCQRKTLFHGVSIRALVTGNVPSSEIMSLTLNFADTGADFALLNDAVLVRKSTGVQVGTVTKAAQDIRIVLEAAHATIPNINSLLQSTNVLCRARTAFDCEVRLSVKGLFGVPTSQTDRSHMTITAHGRRRGGGGGGLKSSQTNDRDNEGDTGARSPLLDENAFELDMNRLDGLGLASQSTRRRSTAVAMTANHSVGNHPLDSRLLHELEVSHTLRASLHPPVFIMGELAVSRIVYAENAGDMPVLTGLESFALDLPTWDGVTITGDLGPLMDTCDAVVFGGKTGITVEKHTISVDGSLLATVTTPGILLYPSNKVTKELGMSTKFEIALRATATREGLIALLRSLCFRSDAPQPVSGTRRFKLTVYVPDRGLHATASMDVDVVQEDQPTVFDIGYSPVVCRSQHAVADELLPLVSGIDNPCYFAANSVVYDFDTADFSGGYLHLFVEVAETETDPSAVSLRVVPYAGSSLQLANPSGGAVFVDDVEIGTLTYLSPSSLIVRFSDNASVIATGVLFRNVVFSSNSDRGQTRIVQAVFVAGKGADPVRATFEVLLDDSLVLHSSGMVRVPGGIVEPQPLGPFVLSSSHNQWDGGFLLIDFPSNWTADDSLQLVPGENVSVHALTQRETARLQADLHLLIHASHPPAGPGERRRATDKDAPVGIVPERKGLNSRAFLKKKLPDKLREVVTEKARAHEDARLRQLLAARKAFGLNVSEAIVASGSKAIHVDGTKVATLVQCNQFILMLFDGPKKPSYSLSTLEPENAHGNVPQRVVSTILSRLFFTGNVGIKSVRLTSCDGHPHLSVTAMQVEIGCSDEVTKLLRPLSPRTFRCRSTEDDEGFCLFGDVVLENTVINVFNGAVIEAGFLGNAQSSGDQLSLLTVPQQLAQGSSTEQLITLEPLASPTNPAAVSLNTASAPSERQGTIAVLAPDPEDGPLTVDAENRGGGVGALHLGGKRIGVVSFDTPNAAGTSNIRIEFDRSADPDAADEISSHEQARATPGIVSLDIVQRMLNAITYTNVAATVKAGSRVCHCTVGHEGAEGKLSLVLAVKAPTLFTARPHTLPRLMSVEMKWSRLPPPPQSPRSGHVVENSNIAPTEAVGKADDDSAAHLGAPSAADRRSRSPAQVEIVDANSEGSSSDDEAGDECLMLLVCPDAVFNVPNTSASVKEGSVSVTIYRRDKDDERLQTEEHQQQPTTAQASPSSTSAQLLNIPTTSGGTKRRRSLQAAATAASFDTSIVFSGGVDWSQLSLPAGQRPNSAARKPTVAASQPPAAAAAAASQSRAAPPGATAGASTTTPTPGAEGEEDDNPIITFSKKDGAEEDAAGDAKSLESEPGPEANDRDVATHDRMFVSLDTDYALRATSVVEGSFAEHSRKRSVHSLDRGEPGPHEDHGNGLHAALSNASIARKDTMSPEAIAALSEVGELFFVDPSDGSLYIARPVEEEEGDDDDDASTGADRSRATSACSAPPSAGKPSPSTLAVNSSPAGPGSPAGRSQRSISALSGDRDEDDEGPADALSGTGTSDRKELEAMEGYEMLYGGKVSEGSDGSWNIAFDYRSEMTIARLQALLRRLKLVVRRDFARRMIREVGVHVFYLEIAWVSRDGAPDVMIVPVAAMPLHKRSAIAHYRSVLPKEGASTTSTPPSPPGASKDSTTTASSPAAGSPGRQQPGAGNQSRPQTAPDADNTAAATAVAEDASGPQFFAGVSPGFLTRTGAPSSVFNAVQLDRATLTTNLVDGLGLAQASPRTAASPPRTADSADGAPPSGRRARSTSLRRRDSSSSQQPPRRRDSEANSETAADANGTTSSTPQVPPLPPGKTVFFVVDIESRLPQTVQAALTDEGTPLRVALNSLEGASAGDPSQGGISTPAPSLYGENEKHVGRAVDIVDFDTLQPLAGATAPAAATSGNPSGSTQAPKPPRGGPAVGNPRAGASFRHQPSMALKAGPAQPPQNVQDVLTAGKGHLMRKHDSHVAFALQFDVDAGTTRTDGESDAELFISCAEALLRSLSITMAPVPTVVSRQSERWMTVKFSRSVFDGGRFRPAGSDPDPLTIPEDSAEDANVGAALRKRMSRRGVLDPRDRVHGLFKLALTILPSPVFVPGSIRKIGLRFRHMPPASGSSRDRGARRESVANVFNVVDNCVTSSSATLSLQQLFTLRPKAGGSVMTFREGGSILIRLTFAAGQVPPQTSSGFKFPKIAFDEAACHFTAKKGKEREVVPLLGMPVSKIGAAPVELRDLSVDNKRIGVVAMGSMAPGAFAALNVPTSTPGGASGILGMSVGPGTVSSAFGGTGTTSSSASSNAPNNHSVLVAVPMAPNGASRSNATLKALSGFSIDFSEASHPAPLAFACTLVLTDTLSGMSDTTTVVVFKETLAQEKPPKGRRGAAGGPPMPARRAGVLPNPGASLRGRPASSGSGSGGGKTPSRPVSRGRQPTPGTPDDKPGTPAGRSGSGGPRPDSGARRASSATSSSREKDDEKPAASPQPVVAEPEADDSSTTPEPAAE